MRLRVEIVWQGQPWRKRCKVQKLAVVDAVFGIIVSLIYIVKLTFPEMEPEFPGLTSAEQLNNSLALVFLTVANLVQALHAFRLYFVISKEEGRDPAYCFEASKTWYDFTQFSYLFITVKAIITLSYIIKVAPQPWVVALAAVTFPEVIFKIYMLVTIYGFMKDLKQSLKYMPKFRFIPVRYSSNDDGEKADMEEDFNFDKYNIDVNANTNLLV